MMGNATANGLSLRRQAELLVEWRRMGLRHLSPWAGNITYDPYAWPSGGCTVFAYRKGKMQECAAALLPYISQSDWDCYFYGNDYDALDNRWHRYIRCAGWARALAEVIARLLDDGYTATQPTGVRR